ncbi:ribokinase [Actinomycetes bacterium]|nr:ribokinase [Actinomycetes bacterium]
MPSVLVIGEALVDVVHGINGEIKNIPGGSPANTAVALARLGTKTYMKARTSTDKFGTEIRNYLTNQNVNLDYSLVVKSPSSVVNALIQKDGSAQYEANLRGAADYGWTFEELDQVIDPDIQIVQLGSLTSYIEPGATNVEEWFSQLRQSNKYLLTFDPNIRHPLDGENEVEVRSRAKKLASLSHVVKASDEDLNWIFSNNNPQDSAINIIESGASLVVVTLGKKGAFAVNKKLEIVEVTANEIEVIDTIGAGDTFAAALITQLLENSWINKNALDILSSDDLTEILTNCSAASAITCSREGANPPHRHEVSW